MAEDPKALVVQCGECRTTVLAEVAGRVSSTEGDDDFWYDAVLLKCPACKGAIFGTRSIEYFAYPKEHMDWGGLKRLWPRPFGVLDHRIPSRVRKSLEEAQKCVGAESYLAAAVMVRRALEAVTNQFGVEKGSLPRRLAELREKGVIDARMFEWAESLRQHGNLGAHDSEGSVSEQDARDLLEFGEAICEYVFVLTKKFAEFKERQAASGASGPAEAKEVSGPDKA